jgi:hypothetical protein
MTNFKSKDKDTIKESLCYNIIVISYCYNIITILFFILDITYCVEKIICCRICPHLATLFAFGNAEMIKEHKLLLHQTCSYFDHLVIKSSDHHPGSHPFLIFKDPLTGLSFPLISISKRCLVL